MSKVLQTAIMGILGGILAAAIFAHVNSAHATSFKVLHSFSAGHDGCYPVGGLVIDGSGNLYGTTAGGGGCNCGTVFKIAPHGGETLLHNFTCKDNGQGPDDTLLLDQKGNLFGGTVAGGKIGCGVIFEVKSSGRERTAHDFAGPPNDGCTAQGTLIEDATGDFYGTTSGGGKYRDGTVFEMNPRGGVKLLHSFEHGRKGDNPTAGVIMGASGDFYGTTEAGGSKLSGVVYELTPTGVEKVLHTFKGSPNDGSEPLAGVTMDASGDLFGVTYYGGKRGCAANLGCGIAFEIAPDGTETVLHFFSGKHADGFNPLAGLIEDVAGNLYGTTENGGGQCAYDEAYGCGTVFELAPDGTETILYSFSKKDAANGALPQAGLVGDGNGHLYGTASEGGQYGCGTVFEITP